MLNTPSSSSQILYGTSRLLADKGLLSKAAIIDAVREAETNQVSLLDWLVSQGKLDANLALELAAEEFGLPIIDTRALDHKQLPLDLIDEELIRKHQLLPLYKRGNHLFVGISDPTQTHALSEVRFHTGCHVEAILVAAKQLKHSIETAINQMGTNIDDLDSDFDLKEDIPAEDLAADTFDPNQVDDTPVVRFVNKVLLDAIRQGASDIHFEPYESRYRVRIRIDGILHQQAEAPTPLATRISSRLKVMASLDIAEKRIPQDGRAKLRLSKNKSIDFRVSTLPTLFGEKVVLRILDASVAQLGIDSLGYEDEQKQLYLDAINRPYGMVLVTGPTGSGKSVSLYTALNILNTGEVNISTVEDPVEIRVEGINQVAQNTKRGLTFSSALRSFLRQDPDVIMVGEIRDLETAEIAIKAAQTGHMVLSTVHTNDAAQTITRLLNMGIAPYNITSSVTLVVAQRLVRRLHSCKKPAQLPPEALLEEGFSQAEIDAGLTIYEAVGCDDCTDGYKGRTGIYQIMPMYESIKKIILENGNALEIAAQAKHEGVADLRTSALRKVRAGITSLTEVNRVTNV